MITLVRNIFRDDLTSHFRLNVMTIINFLPLWKLLNNDIGLVKKK